MQSAIETSPVEAILQSLRLIFPDGYVVELRAFRQNPKSHSTTTISGFYDNLETLAADIASINNGTTVYITLNPIAASWQTVNNQAYVSTSALLNELEEAGIDPAASPRLKAKKNLNAGNTFYSLRTTDDEDIASRRRILIDIDAGQPAETNSSDEEKTTAKEMAIAIRDYLVSLGFSEPAICDSGNGWHLLPLVDLPNDSTATTLVQRFLLALAQRFDGKFGKAHVDTGVFNAARITKAYGSVAFKGEATTDRPHRRSAVISAGSNDTNLRELIEKVAAEYTQPIIEKAAESEAIGDAEQMKQAERLQKFLTWADIEFDEAYTADGSVVIPIACPNKNEHTKSGAPSETICTVRTSGAKGFCCLHTHCRHLDWKAFRALVEAEHAKEHPNTPAFVWGGTVTVGSKKLKSQPEDSEGHTESQTGAPMIEVEEPIAPITTTVEDMPDSCFEGKLGEIAKKRLSRFPNAFAWPALVTCAGVMIPKHDHGVIIGKSDDRVIRTNLYCGLVGGVGCGKSSCIDQAVAVIGVPEAILESSKVGSGEGLMKAMNQKCGLEGSSMLFAPDELLHTLEKSSIQSSSLPTVIASAFYKDSDATITKGDKWEYRARLSIIGGIIPQVFGKSFGSGSVGGMYDRFAFGHAPTNFEFSYRPTELLIESTSPIPVAVNPDVWEWRDVWVKANKGTSSRIIEIALRFAYICACYDHRVLQAKDMDAALAVAKYQVRMRDLLKPNVGETNEAKLEEAIAIWMRQYASDGQWVRGHDLKSGVHAYRAGYGFRTFESALNNLDREDVLDVHINKANKRVKVRLKQEGESL